jgi:hypothetical protein
MLHSRRTLFLRQNPSVPGTTRSVARQPQVSHRSAVGRPFGVTADPISGERWGSERSCTSNSYNSIIESECGPVPEPEGKRKGGNSACLARIFLNVMCFSDPALRLACHARNIGTDGVNGSTQNG